MSQHDDLSLEAETESSGVLTSPPVSDEEDAEGHVGPAPSLPPADADEEDTEGHKIRGR